MAAKTGGASDASPFGIVFCIFIWVFRELVGRKFSSTTTVPDVGQTNQPCNSKGVFKKFYFQKK
jgi:hypothetical protein